MYSENVRYTILDLDYDIPKLYFCGLFKWPRFLIHKAVTDKGNHELRTTAWYQRKFKVTIYNISCKNLSYITNCIQALTGAVLQW